MNTAKAWLENYAVSVKNDYETLKSMKIDDLRKQLGVTKEQLKFDQKKAREKELKEQYEIGEKRAESFREQQIQLESFFGRPLPVSIYFELGNHRIELATTVDSE